MAHAHVYPPYPISVLEMLSLRCHMTSGRPMLGHHVIMVHLSDYMTPRSCEVAGALAPLHKVHSIKQGRLRDQ